jgi:hypothetical protein
MVGTSTHRPLITTFAMLSSWMAAMSASVVVTHFSAVFMCASLLNGANNADHPPHSGLVVEKL